MVLGRGEGGDENGSSIFVHLTHGEVQRSHAEQVFQLLSTRTRCDGRMLT